MRTALGCLVVMIVLCVASLMSQQPSGGVAGGSSGGGSVTISGTPNVAVTSLPSVTGGVTVTGNTSAGNVDATIKPVVMGGLDSGNAVRQMAVDSAGRITANINGTVSVSSTGVEGTVSHGGAASSVKPLVLGAVNPGTLNVERLSQAAGLLRVLQSNDFIALGDAQSNTSWFASANTSGFSPWPMFPYTYNGSTWDRLRGSTAGLQQAGLGSGATGGVITAVNACDTNAAISVTAGTTAVLATAVSGRKIRVCAVAVSLSAAGTVKFQSGTGTTCGTSTADLTGAMSLATGTPLALGNGLGSVLTTATAVDLCAVAATGNAVGWISYTIF